MNSPAVAYPALRTSNLPPRPLEFLDTRFGALRQGSLQQHGTRIFGRYLDECEFNKTQVHSYDGYDIPYAGRKERFIREIRAAVAEKDISVNHWDEISERLYEQTSAHIPGEDLNFTDSETEQALLNYLVMFINHDCVNSSPRGVVNYALEVIECMSLPSFLETIPDQCWKNFIDYAASLETYFRYYESINRMALDFFSPKIALARAPVLDGQDLGEMIHAVSCAQALRFLGTDFDVIRDGEECDTARNCLSVSVDPALASMKLPLSILCSKIANDIKNCLRTVRDGAERFDSPLERRLKGRSGAGPSRINVTAAPVNCEVWELRFSDNGRGIVFNDILHSLDKACRLSPLFIPEAVREAVQRWRIGDAFAFNEIPYGDLMETIFLYGVSGRGSVTSGMGLWGTAALLSRLGAQIKIGITPGTGGFYESIYLPMNLDVSPETVKRARNSDNSR